MKEKSTKKMFEDFYKKPFEKITSDDIGEGEEINWGSDVGGEIFNDRGSNTLDGLKIQKEARGPWDEWDERDMKNAKLFNEIHRQKNRYGMNTISEVLLELSRKNLEHEYYSKFPVDIQKIKTIDKELTLEKAKEELAEKFQNFIDSLLCINESKEEQHMVLFGSQYIDNDGYIGCTSYLCSIEELLQANDVDEVQTYAYIDVPWNEAVNYYVADTEYTRDNIYSVVADFINEITYFGFDKETHDNGLANLNKTIRDFEETSLDSNIFSSEVDNIEDKTIVSYKEEQELYDSAIQAVNDFNSYCRRNEMLLIKESLQHK